MPYPLVLRKLARKVPVCVPASLYWGRAQRPARDQEKYMKDWAKHTAHWLKVRNIRRQDDHGEPRSRKGGYARTNLQGTEGHWETKKISYTQSKVADGVWQKTKTSPMILSLNNVDTQILDIGWTLLKTSTGGNFTWTTSSTSAGYESKLNFCINFF